MRRVVDERGQAAVELVALLPVVALLAAVLWQVAIAGQVVWLAGSAARAASRAHALGTDTERAVRGVLPEDLEEGMRVRARSDGAVEVTLPVRSVFGSERLASVGAKARFEPQGNDE